MMGRAVGPMSSRIFRGFVAAVVVGLVLGTSSPCFPQSERLTVATRIVPPLVIGDANRLTGFSIDLWDAIAKRINVESRFEIYPTVGDLLEAVKNHKAELGIAAISITAERDRDVDFSQPILGAGLQIMI